MRWGFASKQTRADRASTQQCIAVRFRTSRKFHEHARRPESSSQVSSNGNSSSSSVHSRPRHSRPRQRSSSVAALGKRTERIDARVEASCVQLAGAALLLLL